MKYVPLHLHTEYSLLDGAIKIPDLYKYAAENDMPAVAITDHGVMYGCADMFIAKNEMLSHMLSDDVQELKQKIQNVKPLIGCEFYLCEGDVIANTENKTRYHLILIAKNAKGYHNLCKLDSLACTKGFYYKPRINHQMLEQYCGDLICLSACIQGELAKAVLDEGKEAGIKVAKYYKNLFKDDYYIELQDHGLQEQKLSNPILIEIAKELDIKTVITNDSHYLKAQDALWHDSLLCEQTKSKKSQEHRFRFPNNEFYVKTVDELREAFLWMDDDYFNKAIETTVEIANKCDFEMDKLEFGKTKEYLPKYPCPDNLSEEEYFDKLCIEGLKERYGDPIPDNIKERYEYEKGVIFHMGFPAYFLLTWDFINWAKKNNIPVGPGRGSAAGSIVAYALKITELDPIYHNLLFERFLNPERISMPDVDIDFCQRRRGEVIEYVSKKWGEDHVCQIMTFGTLAAKAAFKAVCRVYEIPFQQANIWGGLIPSGPKVKLKDALEPGMELKKLYDENPQVQNLVDEAMNMEGLKNQIGTHAAGVIIAPKPMDEIIPVALSVKEKSPATQYPMAGIEKIGLLKMDFLGLETLTIIHDALELIKARTGKDIDINKIPLDDKETYEMLSRGETDAVFQLESSGMKGLVKRLKPNVFEDLGALVALYRPGPLEAGMIDGFVNRKHGREKIEYPHPLLENILKDTYGVIIYQEQIMQIFQTLADYSLGDADMVRRMMGKKKLEQMAEQKERFVKASAKKDMKEKDAVELFEKIEKFAEYCFNRAHSAAYAFIAYQTAYLKAHYPVEFMCAMLSSVAGDNEKTQSYILQCQALGINVLAPDINKSNLQFTPDGDDIRFGLASIKNVGEAVIEQIELERKNKKFESFYDFCSRVDSKCLNKRTLESLIKAGAFSSIEKSRKQLFNNLENVVEYVQSVSKNQESGQVSLFECVDADIKEELNIPKFTLQGSDEEFKDSEIQQFEKELMGIYVTSHPLASIKNILKYLTTKTITEIKQKPSDNSFVTVCGLLSQIQKKLKKDDPTKVIKKGTIEDLTDRINVIAFSKIVDKFNDLIEDDRKVIINGKLMVQEDEVTLSIQDIKPIEEVNIVTIKMLKHFEIEENVLLKEYLAKYRGNNPVVIDFESKDESDKNKRFQMLVSNRLWVDVNNDIQNDLMKNFKDKMEIEIKTLS